MHACAMVRKYICGIVLNKNNMTQHAFYSTLLLLTALLFGWRAQAQTQYNTLHKVADGLHFMYYDSSRSKSVVLEMDNYLTLIEVPVLDHGGGVTNLKEDYAGGEKVLRTLSHYFPNKPLRYVLNSHWHQHSLSALNAFLKNGVIWYTTPSTYHRILAFADTTSIKIGKNVHLVQQDSLTLGDASNSVVLHYFRQRDFPNAPTEEYLYFYLPRYNYLHCGCMFTRSASARFKEKEIITGRAEDLHRLIKQRGLSPTALIRLPREKDYPEDMQAYTVLEQLLKNGVRTSDIINQYMYLPDSTLLHHTDRIATTAIAEKTPAGIFNTLAYQSLSAEKLPRAIAYAHIQALINPANPNVWDTLGEMYWAMGAFDIARYYERQSRLIDPKFKEGGAEAWEKEAAARKAVKQ